MRNLIKETVGSVNYDLFEEQIETDGEQRTAYGITVSDSCETVDIHDVSTVQEKASMIFETMIRNFVTPVHAKYIVEDMLAC
ncbi:MAG: DUF6514 family protein [Oscillospiraceae bacterium]|nr:DUF6514 family protein [Oscillospiraceae bacterium]